MRSLRDSRSFGNMLDCSFHSSRPLMLSVLWGGIWGLGMDLRSNLLRWSLSSIRKCFLLGHIGLGIGSLVSLERMRDCFLL